MGDLDFTKEARDIIWRRAKETVPRVESSVPIWRYTDTARRWYGQIYTHQSKPRAKNADQVVADLQLAYFYVVNFLELTINGIFKHNAFNSAGNKKDAIWCKQRVDVCMKNMEEIIKLWNLTEEARIQREVMRELDGGADDDDDFDDGSSSAWYFQADSKKTRDELMAQIMMNIKNLWAVSFQKSNHEVLDSLPGGIVH